MPISIDGRYQNIQLKQIVFGIDRDDSGILFDDHPDAFHPESVVILIRFRRLGQIVIHIDIALIGVFKVDRHHVHVLLDVDADRFVLVIVVLDRFDRVVERVAEKGIDIGRAHERDAFAIGDAVDFDIVLRAGVCLFKEDDVQGLVAGFDVDVAHRDDPVQLL